MEAVQVQYDEKVQPGWIYNSKKKKFQPSEDQLNLDITESSFKLEVKEISAKELNSFKGKLKDKFWADDVRSEPLRLCMFSCHVSIEKRVNGCDGKNVKSEYITKVSYAHYLNIMIKSFEKQDKPLPEEIYYILEKKLKSRRVENSMWNKFMNRTSAIKIYDMNQSKQKTHFQSPGKAIHQILNELNFKHNHNKFVAVRVFVRKLPNCVEIDNSFKFIFNMNNPQPQSRFLKIIRYIFFGAQDTKTIRSESHTMFTPEIMWDNECVGPQIGTLENLNINAIKDNQQVDSLMPIDTLKSVSEGECLAEEILLMTLDDTNEPNQYKQSEESLTNLSQAVESKVCPIPKEVKCNHKRSISECPAPMKDTSKKLKLEEPLRTENKEGFNHYYFNCPLYSTGENIKTLLLIGSDDNDMLSLVNLVWYFLSKNTEKEAKLKPVVDILPNVSCVSYYHFTPSETDEELVIIVTPKLTDTSLGILKKYLSAGTINIHALGFVFSSRSEALTSEERSFFSYLRSSFGEVSNHHLLALVTHCDFSRNFPVLEEMKKLSIKPKRTLEFRNTDMASVVELDDLDKRFVKLEFKSMKKVLNFLKDIPMLSVKSMKMEQEKSYVENYLAKSLCRLQEELKHFVSLVDSGGKNIEVEKINIIWKLAKLVTAIEGRCTSEMELLEFVANSLIKVSSENGSTFTYFLLLVLGCPERNITISVSNILKLHFKIYSAFYMDPKTFQDMPTSSSILYDDNTASLYCNQCKDIHSFTRDNQEESFLALNCQSCKCSGVHHSLWTFKDALHLSLHICKVASQSIWDSYGDLPKLQFEMGFCSYLNTLTEFYPGYEPLLQTLQNDKELRKDLLLLTESDRTG